MTTGPTYPVASFPAPWHPAAGIRSPEQETCGIPSCLHRHGPVLAAVDPAGEDSYTLRYARALVQQMGEELRVVHHRPGAPARPLHAAAHMRRARLLILAAEDESHAARRALGQLARQLLPGLPCPLLVLSSVSEAAVSTAGRWPRVLAAIDFSQASVAGLRLARAMAEDELIALHCAACGNTGACSRCLERLRLLVPCGATDAVPVRHVVVSGHPADLILGQAQDARADLIVLGMPAIAESKPNRAETSTICEVIEGVECPLLLIPEHRASGHASVITQIAFSS